MIAEAAYADLAVIGLAGPRMHDDNDDGRAGGRSADPVGFVGGHARSRSLRVDRLRSATAATIAVARA